MELTREQIQKINTFLEGIGIEYIDIRVEMIDHIASDIENNIEDIDSFFEHDGFNTSFLRYMLSKKKSLLKKYNKQLKKLNWYYFKNLCKELLNLVVQPKYLFTIILFVLVSIRFGDVYFKELSIIYFSLLLLWYLVTLYVSYRIPKSYRNIKLIRFYVAVNSVSSVLIINFPNISTTIYDGNYSRTTMFMYLISLTITSLVHINFFQKQNKIFNTYKYLIQ